VRLNLQKIKHLYFIYGLINTLVIVSVLIVVFLLSNKFSRLDGYSKTLTKEVLNVFSYRDLSSELATSRLLNGDVIERSENTEKAEFIKRIVESRKQVVEINEEHSISDIHFTENTYSLTLDYIDLRKQNELLYQYLDELGGKNHGLYYKLSMASKDFSDKLNQYNPDALLNKDFNYLLSTIELFLQSRNEKLVENIETQLKQINNRLNKLASGRENYMLLRLQDSFTNFETSYYEFIKKAFEIGLNSNKGMLSKINNSYSKIAFRLEQAIEIIDNEKRKTERFVFISVALVILIVLTFNLLISRFFLKSTRNFVDNVINHIKVLGKGTFLQFDKSLFPIETHQLLATLETFSLKLISAADVSRTLAKGKTSVELKKEEQFEVFHSSLSKIKQNIDELNKSVREEKKKQINMLWIKSGIDKLTNVMRREYDNPLLHASEVVNMLVKFLNIPIGAIYSIKEENGKKYVEMMASFAYGKEKQLYQKIAIGEGIVGTAASEKKTLNLTSIPEGYFNIISGFGDTKPKNILVSPIKLNEDIYGVFELASLTRFKQEEIDFVEEVCKTVAYSFAISKVYLDTLYQFEGVNMEVAQLEAENASLSNDYDELNESYKQLTKKGGDNSFIASKLNEIALVVDLDLDGNILEVNEGFEKFFKSAKLKVLNSNFREYMTDINLSKDYDIELIWRDVRAGIQHEANQRVRFSDREYVLNQHFWPLKDEMGRVKKVKVIAFDFSSKMGLEAEPHK